MKYFILMLIVAGEVRAQDFPVPRAGSMSLARRADEIEASLGIPPYDPGRSSVDWDPYMPPVVSQSRRNRGRGSASFYKPYDDVRPIRHPRPFPPTGPTRMLRGSGGEITPEYLIPYGKRGNYRFSGWR